ncbi:MAG: hypothetical protein ACUZ8O_16985 [Candidatus Anammoxibacter sp.]
MRIIFTKNVTETTTVNIAIEGGNRRGGLENRKGKSRVVFLDVDEDKSINDNKPTR